MPNARQLYIAFESLDDALEHRNQHGGWIFAPHTVAEFIWFHPAYTHTAICNHHATHGLEGYIGCNAAQLTPAAYRPRYRIYTGPTIVGQIATTLRDGGITVFLEGTEHVYVQGCTPEQLLATLGSGFTLSDVHPLPDGPAPQEAQCNAK